MHLGDLRKRVKERHVWRPSGGEPGEGERAQGRSVIARAFADDLVLAGAGCVDPVLPCELDRRLGGFAAAGDEKHVGKFGRGEAGRERCRPLLNVGAERGAMRKGHAVQLRLDRGDDLGDAVAEVAGEGPGRAI